MFYQSKFLLVVCIMLVLVSFEVLAHDTPKIRDGSQTHTLSKVWSDGEGHWHEDADGRGAGNWDDCVADAYDPDTNSYNLPGGKCPEDLIPDPEPEPEPDPEPDPPLPEPELITLPPDPTPIRPEPDPPRQDSPRPDPPRPQPETSTPQPRSRRRPSRGPASTKVIVEEMDEAVERSESESELEPVVFEQPELEPVALEQPELEPVALEQHEYELFAGYTLIGFPVRLLENRKIQEFYNNNDFFDSPTEGIYIHLPVEGLEKSWHFYNGEGMFENLPIPLWSHFGMIVKLDEAETMKMEGVPLEGRPIVSIRVGWNLIGLPEVPKFYKRPSDFLSDVVCGVLITDGDEIGFKFVAREGDPGDELLYAGQGIILDSIEEFRLDLSGSIAAAPQAQVQKTLVMGWGGMKQ